MGNVKILSQERRFEASTHGRCVTLYSREAEFAGSLDSLLLDLNLSNQIRPFCIETPVLLRASKLSPKGVSNTA